MEQKADAEIVSRILKGERDAYALLIEAYKGPVFNLVFRMTGSYSDTDDLSQEIFIRAYQNLQQFDQDKKFFTWLYTLGINLIRNHLKKKEKDAENHTIEHPFPEPKTKGDASGEGNVPSEESMRRLDENMRKLPVDLREAIILKFYQDRTFEEVAAVTGDSLSAVKMRVYRGLQRLKQLMEVVKL